MPPLEEELQRILQELTNLLDSQLDEKPQIQPEPKNQLTDPFYNVHFLFPRTSRDPRRTD